MPWVFLVLAGAFVGAQVDDALEGGSRSIVGWLVGAALIGVLAGLLFAFWPRRRFSR